MAIVEGHSYIKQEVMVGDIDSANQTFTVSENYLEIMLFYNGILYDPTSPKFGFQTFPGSNHIITDFTPDQGDCLLAFFVTERIPDTIKGDFPSLVVDLIESPGFSLESLSPRIGAEGLGIKVNAGDLTPVVDAGSMKPTVNVS